jgi:hypothetical protein
LLNWLGSLDIDLGIDIFKTNGGIDRASWLVTGLEEVLTGRFYMRETDTSCVLLGTTSASAWVYIYERLTVRSLSMLVLHVSIQSRIRKVSFVTIVALVISSLDIILGSPFLLTALGIFPTFHSIIIRWGFALLTLWVIL